MHSPNIRCSGCGKHLPCFTGDCDWKKAGFYIAFGILFTLPATKYAQAYMTNKSR